MNFIFRYFSLIFLCLFISCKRKSITRDYFTVNSITSGSSIKLVNGYEVILIGIEDSKKSKEFMELNLKGKKVKFVFDNFSPFKRLTAKARDRSFYAYVISNKKCVNSLMLKEGFTTINYTPYLSDSLLSYKNYVYRLKNNRNDDIVLYKNEKQEKNKKNLKKQDFSLNRDEENFNEEVFFSKGPQGELEKLKIACDYLNPITRDFAVKNAGKSSGAFHIEQVLNIYDAIRPPKWNYVNDPKRYNYISKASNTISRTNLSGDCDDFAVLMYSMITAIGGEARIVFAWTENNGHAFCEVKLKDKNLSRLLKKIQSHFSDYSIKEIHYRTSNNEKWLNLDWWAAYPGGKYWKFNKEIIFYPDQNLFLDSKSINNH